MPDTTIDRRSSMASLTVVPAEGGRIQNLVDGMTKRELLLQRSPVNTARTDFLESCTGGWDELFPNDSAWNHYPDHGLIWTEVFDRAVTDGGALVLQTTLSDPSVSVTRRISLLDSPRRGARSEITLSAISETGPFLWAAHPMLSVSEGWTIDLPGSATNFEVDDDLPGRAGSGRKIDRLEWERYKTIPPISSGVAEVIYVDGVSEAVVHSSDGLSATRVSWDSSFLSHLWLVVITGAYGLDDCLLIEPCTTRPYRLDDAIEAGAAPSLDAGTSVTWWVEVESLDNTT